MPMLLLKGVHLASTGDHISADGSFAPLSKQDLKQIVMSHNNKRHNPPIVLGHSGDDPRRVPKNDSQPRFGFPHRLYTIDDEKTTKLYGDLKITPQLAELIRNGEYFARSISFYPSSSPINPTPGLKHLRHIAMLGAVPPAIKGLEDIVEFSEGNNTMTTAPTKKEKLNQLEMTLERAPKLAQELTEALIELQEANEKEDYSEAITTDFQEEEVVAEEVSETQKFMDENAANILRAIIAEGDGGFKGEIVRFEPEPSIDNLYLFDPETGIISGKFIDDSEEVIKFMIDQKQGIKEFQPEDTTEEGTNLSEAPATLKAKYNEIPAEALAAPANLKSFGEGKMMIQEEGQPIELNREQIIKTREVGIENMGEKKLSFAEEKEMLMNQIAELRERRMMNMQKEEEEQMTAEMQELMMLREQVKQLTEELGESRRVSIASFADKQYSEGRLSEGSTPKADLVALMEAIQNSGDSGVVSFSECGESKEGTMLQAFQNFVNNLPKVVEFGEMAVESKPAKSYKPGDVDDSKEVHRLAVEYCEDHGMNHGILSNYLKAVDFVKYEA